MKFSGKIVAMSSSGGAVLGMSIGGGIGAVLGAAVGATIGLIAGDEELSVPKSRPNKYNGIMTVRYSLGKSDKTGMNSDSEGKFRLRYQDSGEYAK